jgi:hypothetical protein
MVISDNFLKDNFLEFKTSGKLIHDEGPTKCSPGDPQIVWDNTWKLQSNNTITAINGMGAYFKIVNLTENSLTLIEVDGPGTHDSYDLIPY